MKKYFLSIFIIVFFGCENQLEEYKPEPNIFCLLRTDKDTTLALVGMSIKFSDTLNVPWRWNGVSGASVKIDYGDGEVQFRELEDSVGFYMTDSLKITPEKIYHLEIKYPDGRVVKGITTVPDSFSITNVVNIDTIIDSLFQYAMVKITLAWERSRNAMGYQIVGEGYYKSENDSNCYYVKLSTDSNIDSLWLPAEMTSWDSLIGIDTLNLIEVMIKIWALDENYYDYNKLQGEWWYDIGTDPTPYIHLEGGFGVFGSVFVTPERRIEFTLIK